MNENLSTFSSRISEKLKSFLSHYIAYQACLSPQTASYYLSSFLNALTPDSNPGPLGQVSLSLTLDRHLGLWRYLSFPNEDTYQMWLDITNILLIASNTWIVCLYEMISQPRSSDDRILPTFWEWSVFVHCLTFEQRGWEVKRWPRCRKWDSGGTQRDKECCLSSEPSKHWKTE